MSLRNNLPFTDFLRFIFDLLLHNGQIFSIQDPVPPENLCAVYATRETAQVAALVVNFGARLVLLTLFFAELELGLHDGLIRLLRLCLKIL